MIPICSHCDGSVEATNRAWPGYCSAYCRDTNRAQRAQRRLTLRQRRAQRDLERAAARAA